MTIINMTYWKWGSPLQPFHLNWISDLAVVWWDTQATITRTDPWDLTLEWQTLATWWSTKLVRKVGSAPTDSSDWTLVVTETVADTYSVSGYVDTWLTNDTTYYYWAFATSTEWLETISNTPSVTPKGWWKPSANTIVYYPLDWDADDHSLTWSYNASWWNWAYYAAWLGWKQCGDFSKANNTWLYSSCNTTPMTVSFLMKWHDLNANKQDWRQIMWMTSDWWSSWCVRAKPLYYNSTTVEWAWFAFNTGWELEVTNASLVDLNWHHICLTTDWTTTYFYFDGNVIGTKSWILTAGSTFVCGSVVWMNEYRVNAYIQNIILESVNWTQQDVQNYYNEFLWS